MDIATFQQLVDEHTQAVFRLAYLMLGNREDADDITQEAFFKAYRNLHRFDESREFRPWVMSIAANLCRNHRRSVSRYSKALWHFAGEKIGHQESIEQEITQQADVEQLLEAIRQLRPVEQEIIYLRYFLEFDVATTADILDIRPGTVKSRLHRALKQLEQVMLNNE
jgi:RNA polymerase sigma-70 factor (ECF subfamily)